MELLVQEPAETTIYFIAGFSVILGAIFMYVFSLWLRWRHSYRDFRNLKSIEKDEDY